MFLEWARLHMLWPSWHLELGLLASLAWVLPLPQQSPRGPESCLGFLRPRFPTPRADICPSKDGH